MSIQFILLPLFVLVAMTFVIGFRMAYLRVGALTRGEVRPGDVALREPNWPPHITQVSNAYLNQLEMPVLFYVLTILAIITKHADLLFVLMSWVFVALRVIHAVVHITKNDLRIRGGMFGASVAVLALMWLIYMVRVLLAF